MEYKKCEFAKVGDKIGVTTAAGYYEFVVTEIHRAKPTACKNTLCDWYAGKMTEYFAAYQGQGCYHNANMLKQLKPRILELAEAA